MKAAPVSPADRAILLRRFADGVLEGAIVRETHLPASLIRAERKAAQESAMWPGAEEIARVVVAACQVTSNDPLTIGEPTICTRARGVAFLALRRGRPMLHPAALAKALGAATPSSFASNWSSGGVNLSAKWFDWDQVNTVVEKVYGHVDARVVDLRPEPEAPAPLPPPKAAPTRDPIVKTLTGPAAKSPVLVVNGARAPTKTRVNVVAVDKRATFDMSPGVSHMKPDAPIERRNVDVMTADLCGDPAPGRSALARKPPQPTRRPIADDDGPMSLEDFVRQGRR